MMIQKITNGELNENCYILTRDKNCIVIDPGYAYEELIKYTNKNNLTILAVLLTHGHFDHSKNGFELQKLGIPVYIHKEDADKLYTDNNLSNLVDANFDYYNADYLIDEGKLCIGDFTFDVIHTPGPSKGSVSFIYENNIFCGDTLFENGYGRYDFYDGNYFDIMKSVKHLLKYKKDGYKFFYGH